MKVFIIDSTDGMTEKLEGQSADFINALKTLSLTVEEVHNTLFDKIVKTVKETGFNTVDLPKDVQPDYMVFVAYGMPIVKVVSHKDIQCIFVGEIIGNCVDRFLAYNMNTFTDRIKMWANVIQEGNIIRSKTTEYHDTSTFESDFKALTELKDLCTRMADKIGKFQENLTNGYR